MKRFTKQRGPHDRIFVNFVDHGTTGILGFPNDLLFADQLNDALNSMYKTSSYRKVNSIIIIIILYFYLTGWVKYV